MKRTIVVLAVMLFAASWLRAEEPRDAGFERIFDGKTLQGWHASAKTGHSRASQHKSGGRWVVEDGAIVGSQDIPGNGGILITDRQFGDFEVALEMNNDFGPDSGLFLRSTEEGKCYQAMIDYHGGGNLMLVEINPADVVSVPHDCNCQKLRTTKYKVVAHHETIEKPLEEALVDDYYDYDDYDEEDDLNY